jgi:FkbM family methyltransferase
MPSNIRERSGKAVAEYFGLIGWEPSSIYMVGVGAQYDEIIPMRKVWPNVELFGFEPNPDMEKKLKEDFPGIIYPYAISNYSDVSDFYMPRNWRNGCSLFKHDSRTKTSKATVNVTTLDTIFPKPDHNRNSLLWLDCEGSELNALIGGESFVEHKIAAVNIEMTGLPRGEGWCKPLETHRWLVYHGFLQSWSHTHRTCIGQWDGIYLRYEIFKPEFCNSLDSLERYEKWMIEVEK